MQSFRMGSEDLKYNTGVRWTSLMVHFQRLMGRGHCSFCYIGRAIGQILSDLLYASLVLRRAVSFPLCILTISGPPNPIKSADDTILLSLLSGPSQHHGPTLQEFV